MSYYVTTLADASGLLKERKKAVEQHLQFQSDYDDGDNSYYKWIGDNTKSKAEYQARKDAALTLKNWSRDVNILTDMYNDNTKEGRLVIEFHAPSYLELREYVNEYNEIVSRKLEEYKKSANLILGTNTPTQPQPNTISNILHNPYYVVGGIAILSGIIYVATKD